MSLRTDLPLLKFPSANVPLANCVAWVRKGVEEHDACVVVICNGKGDGEKKCDIGKEHAGSSWTDVLGWHQGEIVWPTSRVAVLIMDRWMGTVPLATGKRLDLDENGRKGA